MPGTVASSPSQISGIQFSRVLGNLGESLILSTDEERRSAHHDLDDEGEKVEIGMYEMREDSNRS